MSFGLPHCPPRRGGKVRRRKLFEYYAFAAEPKTSHRLKSVRGFLKLIFLKCILGLSRAAKNYVGEGGNPVKLIGLFHLVKILV